MKKFVYLGLILLPGLAACNKCGKYKDLACKDPKGAECKQAIENLKTFTSDQCGDKVTGFEAQNSFDDHDEEFDEE